MFQRKLGSEPLAPVLKDYDVVIDYCACMVAITLARHMVNIGNVNVQWSASQLEQNLNATALGDNFNFSIDVNALSHGLLIFRKCFTRRGITVIEIWQEDKAVPSYYDRKYSILSLELKFATFHTPLLHEDDLLSCILQLRNEILAKTKYKPSPYSSPSLVFEAMQIKPMGTNTNVITSQPTSAPTSEPT